MHVRARLKPQLGHLRLDRLNAGHVEGQAIRAQTVQGAERSHDE